MKSIQKTLAIAAILSLTLLMMTGCKNESAQGGPVGVRIAHFPNITHSQALVGLASGEFQKQIGENYDVEFKTFNAGPAELEAFLAGEVDLGYIGPGPAINGYVKSGGELVILAGATNAGAILVSEKDLIIDDLKDLAGKKIAVPQLGNTQHLSLLNLLSQNGLSDTTKGGDVEIVAADNPDIKTLLDSGEVDAAFVPEPWGSRLVAEVGANIILDYDEVFRDGRYTTAVVIGRREYVEAHPKIVEAFLKAHVELTAYINENPAQAHKMVNEQIAVLTSKPLDEAILEQAFSRLTVTFDPEKASVEDFAGFSVNAGFLDEQPDLTDAFYLDLLNKVLIEKGLEPIL